MYSFILIFQILRNVSGLDYSKEAENVAKSYENTYGHELISLEPDEVELKQLNTFAFASCHSLTKVGKEEITIWDRISQFKPDIFMWTGDSIYSRETGCEDIKKAYIDMMNYKPYTEFAKNNKIDGVYDDHDYGINDGDRNFHCKHLSKEYFLDLLNKPSDHYRRARDGVYFSLEYRDPDNPKNSVKIVALDIRFNRDPYREHPKFGKAKSSFFVEALFRIFDAHFNLKCSHDGDFLGEEQWRWLEGQLYNSKASAHILISSIQVYTKYSFVESWKLLPYSQTRLTALLFKTKPKGLVILSGDVHYANVEGDKNLYEITSSGMTHSLKKSRSILAILLSLFISFFSKEVYLYNNFGIINYKYEDHIEANYHIVSDKGEIIKTYSQHFDELIDPYKNPTKDNILCYNFKECKVLSTPTKTILLLLSLYTLTMVFKMCRTIYKKSSQYTILFEQMGEN